ncbi:hypothetical protein [Natronococcus occultus]|uniref:Uncharacterized protein n=1 Tax=Natronococcus occultus SP4 TaxID=694430 RepID=L0JYC2_9EURY|nr:hypothetical protein [Natronococcus occultus]AGB37119.1 hypothetical protein Natoc_1297 [Natronococcus occultus SP4]
MQSDDDTSLDYYLSRRWLRDQVAVLALVFVGVLVVQWFGLRLPDLGPFSAAPRGPAVLLVAVLVVGMWLVLAVVGAIGLVRWLRG